MSTEKLTRFDPVREQLDATPQFELEWLYDDADDPSQVTVFPRDTERSATEWISVDCDSAIPLDEVR